MKTFRHTIHRHQVLLSFKNNKYYMKKLIEAYKAQLLAIQLQQDGKLGIENVKMILTVVVTFFTEMILALRDRNYGQIAAIVFNLLRLGNIIQMAQMAWKEFRDMDEQEAFLVSDHFKQVFDIPNDELEAQIERAVAVVPAVYDLVGDALELLGKGKDLWAQIRSIFAQIAPTQPA